MNKKISYIKALEEIEDIIDGLNGDSVDVDKLSLNVKRATELINLCKERLKRVEQEVNEVIGSEENV